MCVYLVYSTFKSEFDDVEKHYNIFNYRTKYKCEHTNIIKYFWISIGFAKSSPTAREI